MGFSVLNRFDPLGFEHRVGFKAIEDFKLVQMLFVFRVELDRDEMGDDLVGPVFYVSA